MSELLIQEMDPSRVQSQDLLDEEKSIDDRIDDVLKTAGDNGRFQKLALVIICFATNSTGFFYYCFSYLELMP